MSGTFPESVQEILENISSTHLPPAKLETISIGVLQRNGRIKHPTDSQNIRANTENEIQKRSKLQSVLLNVMKMYKFYEKMYTNDIGFKTYISGGCFTAKFCMVILECNPAPDKMQLLSQIANLDYRSQINFFFQPRNGQNPLFWA